MKILRYYKH